MYFAGTNQRSGRLPGCHLDLKAAGGYVFVPPSHVSGRVYELVDQRGPTGTAIDWPAVVRLLRPPRAVPADRTGGDGNVAHLPAWLAGQRAGNRNSALHWAACRAAEAGDQAVLHELISAALAAGLDEQEARRTIASAVRTVARHER